MFNDRKSFLDSSDVYDILQLMLNDMKYFDISWLFYRKYSVRKHFVSKFSDNNDFLVFSDRGPENLVFSDRQIPPSPPSYLMYVLLQTLVPSTMPLSNSN